MIACSNLASEFDADGFTYAVTFSANGEHLVGGGSKGVRVWRMPDGEEMATMKADGIISCLAVSKNGTWITAGTSNGEVLVWDANTHEQVFTYRSHDSTHGGVHGVDFSPDSARLVAGWWSGLSNVWDFARRKLSSGHKDCRLEAVKYSLEGNQIATASRDSVRVWDSNDGRLLVDIQVQVTSYFDRSLLWFGNHVLVISAQKIKEFDASTGSVVAEWSIPGGNHNSRIALPQHRKFLAYSAKDAVTFWDTSTHTQLALIQHPRTIYSFAFSPDDRFLAICGSDRRIITHDLHCDLYSRESTGPFMELTDATLESWKQDRLAEAEKSLTNAITHPGQQNYHVFASRALVRCRQLCSDLANGDADNSLRIQPSVIGYIAKSVSLVGSGDNEEGFRVFDLAFRYCDRANVDHLLLIKAVVLFMAGKRNEAISRVNDLVAMVDCDAIYYVVQAYMYLLLGNSHMERGDYEGAIDSFVRARAQMQHYPVSRLCDISLISGWNFEDLDIRNRRDLCEALYAAGRMKETVEHLLDLMDTFEKDVYTSRPTTEWMSNFICQFLSDPNIGHNVDGKEIIQINPLMISVAVNSRSLSRLVKEWAKATLASCSWRDALVAAKRFVIQKVLIFRAVCERLEMTDPITDAVECFHQMNNELSPETIAHDEQAKWAVDFKHCCITKLERVGDEAADALQHDDAITQYSIALSLNPAVPQGLLCKRSKAYIDCGLWEAGLNDANKAIELDPLSPRGYERKYEALQTAGHYESAVEVFETMLMKMAQSSDPEIRVLDHQYVHPAKTRSVIRGAVQDAIRDSPRVLINTVSGRLVDKSEQAMAFELLPAFNKLISSMTTGIDHARIERDVTEYYRYAMFSHKWEDNEPLYEKVTRTTVHELEESPTNDKLRMFCKMARNDGLYWAWSDTCCINKADHFVLQEALVSMFRWYQGSTQTLVLLRDVRSPSRRGDLVKSIWNSRVWTFQEYHASKVVRFFNKDWTLYLNLDIPNHKESREVVAEMEEAAGVSTRALMVLQPGLDDIRQKLCLASRRETTLLEDEAYSLFGIFSISLPVVYGEGNQALGRLLSQLLTSSGDTSILAWTGKAGSFNSSLPARIGVFSQSLATYVPLAITESKIEVVIARLRNASVNLNSVTKFYDRLDQLRVPSFSGKRMTLPCIAFKLGHLSVSRSGSEQVFLAETAALGTVEIRTTEDLSRHNLLYLIHPWIDFLLDRQPVGSVFDAIQEENSDEQSSRVGELPLLPGHSESPFTATPSRTAQLASKFGLSFGGRAIARHREGAPPRPPSSLSPTERQTRAFRVLARLRQPFSALLLTPSQNVAAFRRVATESLITVQVEEITPAVLNKLIEGVSVLDVL